MDQTTLRDVEGNERLTAGAGAILIVLLAAEGLTILSVERLRTWHVFLGMMLVPVVALKIGSTTYRFVRYYRGDPDYSAKGPPHLVLRVLGPVVTVLTVAVLATGVVLLLTGQRAPWREIHKLCFIAWFAAMTVHVLGHIIETVRIAPRDWRISATRRSSAGRAPGVTQRRTALVGALLVGVALGVAFIPKAHGYDHHGRRDKLGPAAVQPLSSNARP